MRGGVFLVVAGSLLAASPALTQIIEDNPGAVEDPFPDTVAEVDRIRAGRLLAEDWCGDCHAIGQRAASDAAPPFSTLARREEPFLRTFLSHPHPPMPPLTLANDEIDDLVAYIGSLRRLPRRQEATRP